MVRRQVKDLVAPPSRRPSSGRGDSPLTVWPWKGRNIHLLLSGFVRLVCDPAPIGREVTFYLIELRLQKRKRLLISKERKDTQVITGLGSALSGIVQNKPSIRRPARGVFIETIVHEQSLGPGSARCL